MVKKISAIQTIDISNLVEKADYNTKIEEIKKKIPDNAIYVTTQRFSKSTADIFTALPKEAKLATRRDISSVVEKTDFDN